MGVADNVKKPKAKRAAGAEKKTRVPSMPLKFCEVDGIEMDQHRRCRACTALAGPGHDLGKQLFRGLCRYCLDEARGLRIGHDRRLADGSPWMSGEFHGTKNFVWRF